MVTNGHYASCIIRFIFIKKNNKICCENGNKWSLYRQFFNDYRIYTLLMIQCIVKGILHFFIKTGLIHCKSTCVILIRYDRLIRNRQYRSIPQAKCHIVYLRQSINYYFEPILQVIVASFYIQTIAEGFTYSSLLLSLLTGIFGVKVFFWTPPSVRSLGPLRDGSLKI